MCARALLAGCFRYCTSVSGIYGLRNKLKRDMCVCVFVYIFLYARFLANDSVCISAHILYAHTRPEQLGLDVNVQWSSEFLCELSQTHCITPLSPYGTLLPAPHITAAAAAGYEGIFLLRLRFAVDRNLFGTVSSLL